MTELSDAELKALGAEALDLHFAHHKAQLTRLRYEFLARQAKEAGQASGRSRRNIARDQAIREDYVKSDRLYGLIKRLAVAHRVHVRTIHRALNRDPSVIRTPSDFRYADQPAHVETMIAVPEPTPVDARVKPPRKSRAAKKAVADQSTVSPTSRDSSQLALELEEVGREPRTNKTLTEGQE